MTFPELQALAEAAGNAARATAPPGTAVLVILSVDRIECCAGNVVDPADALYMLMGAFEQVAAQRQALAATGGNS